jgi:hypothetical protein
MMSPWDEACLGGDGLIGADFFDWELDFSDPTDFDTLFPLEQDNQEALRDSVSDYRLPLGH